MRGRCILKDLSNNLNFSSFSHIYVENEAVENKNTQNILSHFKNSNLIKINHYKDIFFRKNQDFSVQKHSPKLILAVKHGNFIYNGAQVCEDFGNKYFYYTSSIMNCIYNCEYCYLQGMYTSANIVIFVNLDDVFHEVESLLEKHPVYLCISYDTDILAFEHITGFTKRWIEFAGIHKNLKIEIRTKSANFKCIEKLDPCSNVILAWTLSPEEISKTYEIGTPGFNSRLESIKSAVLSGWNLRICFDPILYLKNWKIYYKDCIDRTFEAVPSEKIQDISIGVFRISKDYLKKMKKVNPYSIVLSYPFKVQNGVCTYADIHHKTMIDFVYNLLSKYVEKEKIFI